jgi:ribonuclease VapC
VFSAGDDRVTGRGGCRDRAQDRGLTEAHAALARAAFDRYGKGRHAAGLNFGDRMAYAVAKAEGRALMFTGGDFAQTNVMEWDG